MSEELSPAFRFYVKDFFLDDRVIPMEDDEVGVYMRLLGAAWLTGSIPADPAEIHGLLPRTKRRDFDRMWKKISRCWTPHPTESGRLVQKRLEKERQKQRENSARRTAAGRTAATARHSKRNANAEPTHSNGNADAMRSDSLSSSFALSSSETTAPQSGARGRDDSVLDEDELDLGTPRREVRLGPALEIATWFIREALEAKALPGHVALDVAGAAYREEPFAQPLVATYDSDEIKRRARNLFARRNHPTNPLKLACSLRTLADPKFWDWFDSALPLGEQISAARTEPAAPRGRAIDSTPDVGATW